MRLVSQEGIVLLKETPSYVRGGLSHSISSMSDAFQAVNCRTMPPDHIVQKVSCESLGRAPPEMDGNDSGLEQQIRSQKHPAHLYIYIYVIYIYIYEIEIYSLSL